MALPPGAIVWSEACDCGISYSFAVSTYLLVPAKLGDVAADRLFIYSNAWCMQAFEAMSKLGG